MVTQLYSKNISLLLNKNLLYRMTYSPNTYINPNFSNISIFRQKKKNDKKSNIYTSAPKFSRYKNTYNPSLTSFFFNSELTNNFPSYSHSMTTHMQSSLQNRVTRSSPRLQKIVQGESEDISSLESMTGSYDSKLNESSGYISPSPRSTRSKSTKKTTQA